jgi:NAD(P)-dependent dehydrogenase (short-subunit alcohol dehydrogenase family)
MRVLVVGATGTVGRAIVAALGREHEVISASRSGAAERVDVTDAGSIGELFSRVGRVDAVVSTVGRRAYKPFAELGEADLEGTLRTKLAGQINLVRLGADAITDGGVFVLTSGIFATRPTPWSAVQSTVNAGVEGFVRAAALGLPRGVRIAAIRPDWIEETLAAIGGRDPATGREARTGVPLADVARAYVQVLVGSETGVIREVVRAA